MPNIIIYSTPSCVYCKKAKAFFDKEGIAYVEKDVRDDAAAKDEMIAKSGQLGVPVIDIDGEIFLGFSQSMIADFLKLDK